jgi:hypothetical protein
LGITGFFGMLNEALPLHRLFGTAFYHCVPPKWVHRLYSALGVERLRRLLCRLHYHKPEVRRQFYGGGRAGLPQLLRSTQCAECCHVLALVAMLPLLPFFIYLGRYDLAAGAAVGNLVANFYPIVLQRQHRARLLRLDTSGPL